MISADDSTLSHNAQNHVFVSSQSKALSKADAEPTEEGFGLTRLRFSKGMDRHRNPEAADPKASISKTADPSCHKMIFRHRCQETMSRTQLLSSISTTDPKTPMPYPVHQYVPKPPRSLKLGAQKAAKARGSDILAPRLNMMGIPEIMVCRILLFMWAFGAL